MKKQCKRRVVRPTLSAFRFAVGEAVTLPASSEADDLMKAPLAQLEELRTGNLEPAGFSVLAECNLIPHCVAEMIVERGTPESQTIAFKLHQQAVRAADALIGLSDRRSRSGRYIATGDELQEIRSSMSLIEQVCQILTRGELIQALRRADKMHDEIEARAKLDMAAA